MRMLATSASRSAGTRLTDATSGFRLICEPLLSQFARAFPRHYLGDTYEAIVSAGRAGYVVREISVEMRERVQGPSSASILSSVRFKIRAVTVAATRLHFPLQAVAATPQCPT